MPRTLVIIAHPNLTGPAGSRVHRRWAAELAAHPDEFEVRDLYALYPGGQLDGEGVAAERAALMRAGTVALQFPVYWYSAPALLRTWMDEVFGFGWAYGGERALPGEPGRALAGKTFACAVSAGDIEANYRAEGTVGFTMEQVLTPFAATANYVGATWAGAPYALFGTEKGLTDAQVDESARAYAAWLRDVGRTGAGARRD